MSVYNEPAVQQLISLALEEDVGSGDVTSIATIPESARLKALFNARELLVVCGLGFLHEVYKRIEPTVQIQLHAKDGDLLQRNQPLAQVEGPARAILTGERVCLNFLQRLCGVATLTREHVQAVAGTQAKVLDTRKTTPGWRALEKYAVLCGGGTNHRHGLYDMVLIKDNHLAALRNAKPNAIAAAVAKARAQFPQLKVEVEADTLEQVQQATDAGADIILLDNMPPAQLRAALAIVKRPMVGPVPDRASPPKTEASGGVNLKTIRAIAETGVDFISVGAITHSARAMDIGLDYLP
ncbi:MAG TPA: carboxylating nicotinate-nucleotide diphosphorylase [Methylomirabilota bacterium]|nr:carboxylating nicotinate-nucleotide diphosphorylase [Methylomirabilota bacterium]